MPERQCRACTLCCRLLPVRELAKTADTRCQHQSSKGCGIYHKPGFPMSCAVWSCRWLIGDDTADQLRPDRSGYVIDVMPDMVRLTNHDTGEVDEIVVIQVWVKPGHDPSNDRRLRQYGERQGTEHGAALLLRWGTSRTVAMFPPALSTDGEWHILAGGSIAPSPTGNLLIDRAIEERSHA